jgi:hypothetical protein
LRYGRQPASLARFSDLCAGHGGSLYVQYGEPSAQQLARRGVPCAQLFALGDAFGVQNDVLAVVLPSSVFLILPSSNPFCLFFLRFVFPEVFLPGKLRSLRFVPSVALG